MEFPVLKYSDDGLPLSLSVRRWNGAVGQSLLEVIPFLTYSLSSQGVPALASPRRLTERDRLLLQRLKKECMNRLAIWPPSMLPRVHYMTISLPPRSNAWDQLPKKWPLESKAITIITPRSWQSQNFKTLFVITTPHCWELYTASTTVCP